MRIWIRHPYCGSIYTNTQSLFGDLLGVLRLVVDGRGGYGEVIFLAVGDASSSVQLYRSVMFIWLRTHTTGAITSRFCVNVTVRSDEWPLALL